MVAMRITAFSPIATMNRRPVTGISLEVSGRTSAIISKYTDMASKMVVINPILSPLSLGIMKLKRDKTHKIALGTMRFSTKYMGFRLRTSSNPTTLKASEQQLDKSSLFKTLISLTVQSPLVTNWSEKTTRF